MKSAPLAVAVAVVLCAPAALACVNGMKAQERKVELLAQDHVRGALKALDGGRFADAVTAAKASRAGLEKEPPAVQTRVLRWADRIEGLAELRQGHLPEAVAALRKAAGGFSEDPYVLTKFGQALVESGAAVEGRAFLEQYAGSGAGDDLIPDADVWVALGRARLQAGDKARALEAARAAVAREPSNAKAKALLAELTAPAPKPPAAKPAATKTSS